MSGKIPPSAAGLLLETDGKMRPRTNKNHDGQIEMKGYRERALNAAGNDIS